MRKASNYHEYIKYYLEQRMKKITIIFTGFLVSILFVTPFAAQKANPTIDSLAFISGCWEINVPEKKRLVSEQWMSPAGNAMIGMSRTVSGGKLSGFEYLRIVQDDTGIRYISKPSQNKDETVFNLIKWSASEAVFENPAHDFPQRIIYKLTKPDTLFARIEGTINGKLSTVDFPMTRTKCA